MKKVMTFSANSAIMLLQLHSISLLAVMPLQTKFNKNSTTMGRIREFRIIPMCFHFTCERSRETLCVRFLEKELSLAGGKTCRAFLFTLQVVIKGVKTTVKGEKVTLKNMD